MPVVNVYEPKKEPIKPELDRTFYFDDSQVVLQASHTFTVFLFTLLTISLCTGGRSDVQSPSLLLNSGVANFQRFIRSLFIGGPRKCRGFRH